MYNHKLYSPVLLLPAREDLPGNFNQAKYSIATLIDDRSVREDRGKFNSLIRGKTPFLLTIDSEKIMSGQLLTQQLHDIITLCQFSENYIRTNNGPLIVFFYSSAKARTAAACSFEQSLLDSLQLQGWPAIIKWQLTGNDLPLLTVDKIDFDESYLAKNFLSKADRIGEHIFFTGASFEQTIELEEQFNRLCISALNENPVTKTYLTLYLHYKAAVRKAEEEALVQKERLENAESTINVVRTKYKDDYDLLFNWYHKEYEVLPLWYKRFGHIIKAFMGKRTFRSLWSDDKNAGH